LLEFNSHQHMLRMWCDEGSLTMQVKTMSISIVMLELEWWINNKYCQAYLCVSISIWIYKIHELAIKEGSLFVLSCGDLLNH
jgi:hypothetical protein